MCKLIRHNCREKPVQPKDAGAFLSACAASLPGFGAGIKRKILEAINYGVPVVTTSIGAEGIGVVHGENILIADSAAEFSEAVVKLHRDKELWGELRDKGRKYVETSFSQKAFQARVDQVMKKLLKT